MIYAHTLRGRSREYWEPLYDSDGHATKVAQLLESFSSPFVNGIFPDDSPVWRVLGLYHDMGKASDAFQRYLEYSASGKAVPTVDHKVAAARWWWDGVPRNPIAMMLAYAFTGHHGGLKHGSEQFGDDFKAGEGIHLEEAIAALPTELRQKEAFSMGRPPAGDAAEEVFQLAMMTRMLHSALVDADWLATEAFMEPEKASARASVPFESIAVLGDKLEMYLSTRESVATGRINSLRREIHASCHTAAAQPQGVYQLNVPTGGGKTLSSLSFALAHAYCHGLQRVIYVIPYTSIIDQTADEFRKVLGEQNVVEHHSNLGEGKDTEQNRYASENWAAPLIVTTAVQFFESLFACENSRCRKLHNIAKSVIIFDEAQTLPSDLLASCLAALKALQKLCGCTLLLCTATQPALERRDGFEIGWAPGEIRSLLGEAFEKRLAHEMKRVEVNELGLLSNESLVAHFREMGASSALFIVNLTRQAQDLYNVFEAAGQEGLYHLSARMCPQHRREVLNTVRERLDAKLPVVLVATRVVEAGVDVSFPLVYRDACGLDSLAQAAGRCNRHGEAAMGQVYSYKSEGYTLPGTFVDLIDGIGARQDSFREGEELFGAESIKRYFRFFYQKRGERSRHWDKVGMMPLFGKNWRFMSEWDFPLMAQRFCLIPGGQVPVLVPYGEEAEALRSRLLALKDSKLSPTREDFRKLQQYSVNVYAAELTRRCAPLYKEMEIYELQNPADYSAATGLQRESTEIDYVL